MEVGETLHVRTAAAWRGWLSRNASQRRDIWLITHKKASKDRSLDYDSTLREALCFGWIDGIVKSGTADYYYCRWSPRRRGGNWTEGNLERVRQLYAEGRMTEAGLAALPPAELERISSSSSGTPSR
jgi:uncharacterized protein YdeI (YjbR/CyaY-like superfamily)